MQVLRNLVSPERKRAKTEYTLDDSDVELEEESDTEKNLKEDVPKWATEQKQMITKMVDMMTDMKNNIGTIKEEVAQIRFQAGVAQAVAEKAREKMEDVETRVFEKIAALEAQIPSVATIQNMIDETLRQTNHEVPKQYRQQTTKSSLLVHGTNEEKFSRIIVVGGFEHDMPKRNIIEFMNKSILKDAVGIDEAFAYNFGSDGFVRFHTRDDMLKFIKDFAAKDKPLV